MITPAFENHNVPVVFSANEGFVPYLAAMLQSIIDHSSDNKNYDIVVLHSSISAESQTKLQDLFVDHVNFSLRFLDVSHIFDSVALFTENQERITRETYYRLAIPYTFEAYDKVIYLDGDMITRRDVADLLAYDLGSNLIASSRDYWGNCQYYVQGDPNGIAAYRKSLGLANKDDYFIAGMLVFNIPQWQAAFSFRQVIDLATSRNWRQHDQDVLNVLCSGRTLILPAQWDYMTDRYHDIGYLPQQFQNEVANASKDPYIIHYGGYRKPWLRQYEELGEFFWEALYKTPFFADVLAHTQSGGISYRAYVLRALLNEDLEESSTRNNVIYSYNGVRMGKLSTARLRFNFIDLDSAKLTLEGLFYFAGLPNTAHFTLYAKTDSSRYAAQRLEYDADRRVRDETVEKAYPFLFSIPLPELQKTSASISFEIDYKGATVPLKALRFNKFCPIGNKLQYCYYHEGGVLLYTDGKKLFLRNSSLSFRFKRSLLLYKEILSHKSGALHAAERLTATAIRRFSHKEIWLFSDRTNKAGDNAEALFRYVQGSRRKEIKAYFILRKDSEDWKRLSTEGFKLLDALSFKHRILHLACTYNISSQADLLSFNPFQNDRAHVLDYLHSPRFVFLQHGVIRSDISGWFNRININPSLFITSASQEYQSIVANKRYAIDPTILKLTGLPRHDALRQKAERIITILPTWRQYLCERTDKDKGVWRIKDGFEESAYYSQFDALFNDHRLIDAAEQHGYSIQVLLHPNMQGARQRFHHNPNVRFLPIDSSYSEIFSRSALVVTDFSSAVFDFLYLRKPVVYCHLDDEELEKNHHVSHMTTTSYDSAFGETAYSVSQLVDIIIRYIDNDCTVPPLYKTRMETFFAFHDHDNCKRVLQEIETLSLQADSQ